VHLISRAFGNSDFKKNKDLPPEEQKLICIPDIKVIDINQNIDKIIITTNEITQSLKPELLFQELEQEIITVDQD